MLQPFILSSNQHPLLKLYLCYFNSASDFKKVCLLILLWRTGNRIAASSEFRGNNITDFYFVKASGVFGFGITLFLIVMLPFGNLLFLAYLLMASAIIFVENSAVDLNTFELNNTSDSDRQAIKAFADGLKANKQNMTPKIILSNIY